MTFFAFIHLVNIQGMGRCSRSTATMEKFLKAHTSLSLANPMGMWLRGTVLKCIPSFHLWKAGQTQREQGRASGNRSSNLLARNQFSMLKGK